MYQTQPTERTPASNRGTPSMQDLPRYMLGPFHKGLVKRNIVLFIIIAIIGMLPSILNRAGVITVSPWLQCAGWGLVIPGGGLIATGTVGGVIVGLIFFIVCMTLGMMTINIFGMYIFVAYLWVISLIGAGVKATADPPLYTWIIVWILILVFIGKTVSGAKKTQKKFLEMRAGHEKRFPDLLKEFQENQVEAEAPEDRELSEDALRASRYFFDMTLNREVGDFSGYDTAEQIQLSAIRYSLDNLGYGLADMQCFCTPNFHGYLKEAQEFVIDSLTGPTNTSFWKLEEIWGNFRWHPNPVDHQNIMFSGWSGILPVIFTGNTGDDKYEQPDSLKFRPFKNRDKYYGYNNEGLCKCISDQWDSTKVNLIPCEPGEIFPWCNGWGINTVLAFDRIHGTDYVEKAYPKLQKRLYEDWTNADGKLAVAKNAYTGTLVADLGNDFTPASAFSVSRIFNAFDPKLAQKEYILSKADSFVWTDDKIESNIGPWEKIGDIGNFKKGPGYVLGTGAVAAQEMGEKDFAERLLKKADEVMERVDDENCHYFKNASVTSNANLALARFAQKDDLYHMIHHGPGEAALTGPILNDCTYPEVLVAKARSHTGMDLELVLYNGEEAGDFHIGIDRLAAGKTYVVQESTQQFTADQNGHADLTIHLDGRTPVHIQPVA